MGMTQSVKFPAALPSWAAVQDVLSTRGFKFQVCMIDGQLAFPNEQPEDSWKELRVKTPQGMITVGRQGDRIQFVIWGNADALLQEQWKALAAAFAESGGGVVE